jgi:hypothetical protein
MSSMMNCYAVDEITILMWNGNDSWGDQLSGALIDVKGCVEWKTRLVRNAKGEEVASSVMVYLPKRRTVRALGRGLLMEDRIILDQGGVEEYYSGMPDEALSRAIIEIRQPKDFSSPHYEIFLA